MLPDFKALVFTHTYGLDSKVRQMFSKNRSVQMFGEDELLQKHKSLAWAKGKNWRWMVILLSVVKHTSEDDVVVVNVTQHWGIERATRFIHSVATTLSHTRYSLPSLRSARKHTKTPLLKKAPASSRRRCRVTPLEASLHANSRVT